MSLTSYRAAPPRDQGNQINLPTAKAQEVSADIQRSPVIKNKTSDCGFPAYPNPSEARMLIVNLAACLCSRHPGAHLWLLFARRCLNWALSPLDCLTNSVPGLNAKKTPARVSLVGAAVVVFAGCFLLFTSWGDAWVTASYDNLFRFGSPAVTNQLTLIRMDKAAFTRYGQTRGQPWDRSWHARLLNRLADDDCPLVVFDSFFQNQQDPQTDNQLAGAMRRLRHIVLLANQSQLEQSKFVADSPELPTEPFLSAAQGNWGVGWVDANADLDGVERRHWPFPSPGPYASLPWRAAELAGAHLSNEPQQRWVRYYGQHGAWETMSYGEAFSVPANYFRDRVVFIGTDPENKLPARGTGLNTDKFDTPYTGWTGESSGGVEIQMAEFLNLWNNQSLLQLPVGLEILILTLAGAGLGGGLCRLRPRLALLVAGSLFLLISGTAIALSYYTNYWFPWLIVAGGQLPAGLGWALITRRGQKTALAKAPDGVAVPETPGYDLVHPPIGEGSYGKVWLALNSSGKWVALKAVYQAKFEHDPIPYDREFNGVQQYRAIAHQHPGLLQVEFVSEKTPDYFYYAMELADSLAADWEANPATYKPSDLVSVRAGLKGRRLPVRDCVKLGIILCQAMEFLHQKGFIHRDIKPQNIVYVKGVPKLADLGLVTGIRPLDQGGTLVGTMGYMPPFPERPGTVAADIYALGMVLYVASTGGLPSHFPEVATTMVKADKPPDFFPLNHVFLKACQPAAADRYATAAQMGEALAQALATMEHSGQISQ